MVTRKTTEIGQAECRRRAQRGQGNGFDPSERNSGITPCAD
jgi:hypothetical protein